jgi:hypothetical protein
MYNRPPNPTPPSPLLFCCSNASALYFSHFEYFPEETGKTVADHRFSNSKMVAQFVGLV